MEQVQAQRLAAELGVHVTQVAREYWEVVILDALLATEHGKHLVFRGGTALSSGLRLAPLLRGPGFRHA